MAEPAKRNATYADIEALPPHVTGEIIHGSLYTQPRPAFVHNAATPSLYAEVSVPYQKGRGGPGGWVFAVEQEVKFGEHLLVPDISGWRRERLPTLPPDNWISVRPDWVCEVTSPSTVLRDRHFKRDISASFAVPHYWMVDPKTRSLEVYELSQGKWMLVGNFSGNAEVSAPPFDAITIQLETLWPLPEPEGFHEDSLE
jgi:Uma2 family endonuclease